MANNSILAKMAVQISANNAQFGAALKQSQKDFKNFADSLKTTLGAVGIGLGIYELVGAIKSVVSVASEFEATMSEVRAITGATGDQFDKLTKDALRLGASTKFTSTQVGQLQVAYGRLGFTTKEILNATEATLALAAATGEDLAKSADVAGSTVRGFGLRANETQRVVDVMAASFNQTALGLENFTEAMKYVAPIAAAAGASVEETTALLGVLADNGIRGSMAGTSLRKIFTDLAKDGRPLRERLAELGQKGITLTDAFDEVGRTAQTSLLILSKNTDRVNELSSAFQNVSGEAERVARIMQDNLQGDVEKLSSAWEGLILKLSNTSVFRAITQDITAMLAALQGGDIDVTLNDLAKRIGNEGVRFAGPFIDELRRLRQESGKPIDIKWVQDLSEKYKLTDEQANDFYSTIVDINKSLSFQEKTIADFKRSNPAATYEDLTQAVEKYKEGIHNQILQNQILIAQSEKNLKYYNNERNAVTESDHVQVESSKKLIASYRRKILILNEYVDANKKATNSVVDATDKEKVYANTLAGARERLKDINEQFEGIDLNNRKALGTSAAEIASLNERIKLVTRLTELYSKPLAIQFKATKIGSSAEDRASNTAGQDLLGMIDAVIKEERTFEIDPEIIARYEAGLERLKQATSKAMTSIKQQYIDVGPLVASVASDIGVALGNAISGTENFGKGLVKALANFAKQFGELLIGLGTAAIAARAVSIAPPAAIAAGIALVAIATAASAGLNKAQSNYNSGSSSGGYSNHGVSSGVYSGTAGNKTQISVTGQIVGKGKDLYVVLSNYQNDSKMTKVTNG